MSKSPGLGLFEAVVNNHGKVVKYLMTGTSHEDILRQIIMEKRLSPVSTRAMHQGFSSDSNECSQQECNILSFARK